jgi:HD-GYP domain-containing protein (c-di-GMP phosphodiesterase class II)
MLYEISPESLRLDSLPFDLWTNDDSGQLSIVLYKGQEVNEFMKKWLLDKGGTLYVLEEDLERLSEYATEKLSEIVGDEDVSSSEKIKFIYLVGKSTVKKLVKNPDNSFVVKESEKLISNYLDSFLVNPGAARELLILTAQDQYMYSHAMNVATFNLLLGHRILGDDKKALWDLGLAGLFHDIGKTKIDPKILYKPGPLTDDEMKIMKRHVEYSHDIIKQHGYKREIQFAGRNHHERIDGDGYPDSLYGDRIHLFAKITAISDVYDALTSSRIYAPEYTHTEALKTMLRSEGHFDETVFDHLLNIVLMDERLARLFKAGKFKLPE